MSQNDTELQKVINLFLNLTKALYTKIKGTDLDAVVYSIFPSHIDFENCLLAFDIYNANTNIDITNSVKNVVNEFCEKNSVKINSIEPSKKDINVVSSVSFKTECSEGCGVIEDKRGSANNYCPLCGARTINVRNIVATHKRDVINVTIDIQNILSKTASYFGVKNLPLTELSLADNVDMFYAEYRFKDIREAKVESDFNGAFKGLKKYLKYIDNKFKVYSKQKPEAINYRRVCRMCLDESTFDEKYHYCRECGSDITNDFVYHAFARFLILL